MKFTVILLCAAALPALAAPRKKQPSPPPAPPRTPEQRLADELHRARESALASNHAWETTEHLCDAIGPRLSGSLGAAAAVDYIAARMRAAGLSVRLQPVMVPHWERGVETGELTAYPGQVAGITRRVALTALGKSPATPPAGITAEIVVVRNRAEFDALPPEKVAGKIVLFNYTFNESLAALGRGSEAYDDAVWYRARGAWLAQKKGAVASLIRSSGSGAYQLPHTGNLTSREPPPSIPAAALSAEDAGLIVRLAARGPVTLHLTLTPRTLPDAASFNVIGDWVGTEFPQQIVILSGHLDSWDLGTGALDDAVGIGAALGAVVALRAAGLKPRRTLRVIAWMNEENGARGGAAYFEAEKDSMANHVAVIEMDTGAGHPAGFLTSASPAAIKQLGPLFAALAPIGAILVTNSAFAIGADVEPLTEAGVPAFSPDQDMRDYFIYHHTAADTLDKVNPALLKENTAALAVLGYLLASMAEPLSR